LLDGLRLLANFKVVFHHMGGGTLFGSAFGVPLFMTLMIALAVSSTRAETARAFGRRKARALLTPWLRWSAVYVALAVAMNLIADRPANAGLSWGMLVVGGHPSPWFLPAALLLLLAVKPIQAGAARLTPGRAPGDRTAR
jgi:fucose 4-O-acetylase-like acetyltransferase